MSTKGNDERKGRGAEEKRQRTYASNGTHEKRINKNYAMFRCSRNYNNLKFTNNPPVIYTHAHIRTQSDLILVFINILCDHITSNRFTDKSDARCIFKLRTPEPLFA